MQILLSTPSVLHHQSGCTQCNISNTASMEIAHLTHHRLIKYQYAPKVALWHQQSSLCLLYPPGNPSMQFCLKLKSSDGRTVWVIPTTPPPTNITDNLCWHYPKSLLPYIGVNRQSRGEKTSRASLTVRITVKNGNPPGTGKIWENRFFTGKMDHHGAKCTQIGAHTCQGSSRTCRIFLRSFLRPQESLF